MTATGSTYMALEIAGLRQLLAERDAEIEQLKAAYDIVQNHLVKAEQKITGLEKFNLMTDEEVILELKAQLERLKEENGALLFTYNQLETEWYAQQKLIGELRASLSEPDPGQEKADGKAEDGAHEPVQQFGLV